MTSGSRLPSWRERENNKKRERRRRAIAGKIFAGLRLYGNYNLPKHCDNNEVLKTLCREAGWIVEPDGTTYRKGCRPVERMDLIGGSTSTGCFASPSSSSYPANPNNIDTNSLIPWLKNLTSGSSTSSSSSSSSMPPHPFIHNGSISAPVTPPLNSPTCRTPRLNPERDGLNWVGQYPFLPLSTPQSPAHQSVPVSEWFAGIRIRNGPSQPTSPTFSLVSPSPFGGGSLMATPGQSGTCSPAIPDVIMTQAIPDEFAFGSNPKGMVKAWEGEIIHEEDTGSDDLELTLGGGSRPRNRNEGGLGIKEILSWNKASNARAIFELHDGKLSNWSKWIAAYKLKGLSIWDTTMKDSDSCYWKSILRLRDHLLSFKTKAELIEIMRNSKGEFNTTALYSALRPEQPSLDWTNHIWGSHHLPRHSFITWLAAHGRLTTLSKLNQWGIVSNTSCCLCNSSPETEAHLWMECSFTKAVLDKVLSWLKISRGFVDLNDWFNWMSNSRSYHSTIYRFRSSALTTIIYFTWQARNNLLYQGISSTPEECSMLIKLSMKGHLEANRKNNSTTRQ